METSVNLQSPFSYAIYPVFIIIIILFVYILVLFCKPKKKVKVKTVQKKQVVDIKKIKNKYLKKLDDVECKMDNNKISIRSAYQSTSNIIRNFVHEVTSIKVQNYTLEEIKLLDMPILYELVSEYYTPEFAEQSVGDIKKSIEKTRKVIEKWS